MSDDITLTTPVRIQARPTTYNGVKMRSRLEAAYAAQFDAFGWQWEYEPRCFATTDGQYLPDFRLTLPEGTGHVYVEVRPNIDLLELVSVQFTKLAHSWQIIKANDDAATGLVLCLGSDADGYVQWFAMNRRTAEPVQVCPARVGSTHVIVADHLGYAWAGPVAPADPPVRALYGKTWGSPRREGDDEMFLALWGYC